MFYGNYNRTNPLDTIEGYVLEAFANLRKAGFIARNKFSCCGGCASCEIATHVEKKDKPISGAVFTTRQDWKGKYSKTVYIKYGAVTLTSGRQFGFDSKTVGRAVVEACNDAGLTVVWSGSTDECIEVHLPPTVANRFGR